MTERKNEIDGMNGASGGFLPAAKILAAGFGWGIIGVFSRPLSAAYRSESVQDSCQRSMDFCGNGTF